MVLSAVEEMFTQGEMAEWLMSGGLLDGTTFIWNLKKCEEPGTWRSSTGDRKYKSWCRKPLLCLGKVASGAGTESTRKQSGHSYWLWQQRFWWPRYTATAEWWGESLTQSSKVNGRGGKEDKRALFSLEKFSCKWKQRNERAEWDQERFHLFSFPLKVREILKHICT